MDINSIPSYQELGCIGRFAVASTFGTLFGGINGLVSIGFKSSYVYKENLTRAEILRNPKHYSFLLGSALATYSITEVCFLVISVIVFISLSPFACRYHV